MSNVNDVTETKKSPKAKKEVKEKKVKKDSSEKKEKKEKEFLIDAYDKLVADKNNIVELSENNPELTQQVLNKFFN